MNVIAPVAFNRDRLEVIKERIARGYERANKGGQEWVEGSLELAAALREARDNIPSNITFKGWLLANKLDFYNKNDRQALISFGDNLEVARTVLTETKSRSYDLIWRENKNRFPRTRKTTDKIHYSKPRVRNPGRAMILRKMKLGEGVIDSLKGTTLDSALEMDELVILNRGAPPGELNKVVSRLVQEAIAGKEVSALAYTASLAGSNTRKHVPTLMDAWKKHMIFPWKRAGWAEREKFLQHVMEMHTAKEAAE